MSSFTTKFHGLAKVNKVEGFCAQVIWDNHGLDTISLFVEIDIPHRLLEWPAEDLVLSSPAKMVDRNYNYPTCNSGHLDLQRVYQYQHWSVNRKELLTTLYNPPFV